LATASVSNRQLIPAACESSAAIQNDSEGIWGAEKPPWLASKSAHTSSFRGRSAYRTGERDQARLPSWKSTATTTANKLAKDFGIGTGLKALALGHKKYRRRIRCNKQRNDGRLFNL